MNLEQQVEHLDSQVERLYVIWHDESYNHESAQFKQEMSTLINTARTLVNLLSESGRTVTAVATLEK